MSNYDLPSDVVAQIDQGTQEARAIFLETVEKYRKNKGQGVPDAPLIVALHNEFMQLEHEKLSNFLTLLIVSSANSVDLSDFRF